jgi:hypothetical protein
MRSILKSTRAFEAWMQQRTDISGKLLKKKHRKMGEGVSISAGDILSLG